MNWKGCSRRPDPRKMPKTSGESLIVFLVGANPVPNKKIIQKGAHGAVVGTNSDTPLVRPHLFKPQGGMKRILNPETVVFSRQLADFLGKSPVKFPKLGRGLA